MGGIEGESVTVTWKSQDPAPLPETGITKSKEAQVELPLLKNIKVYSMAANFRVWFGNRRYFTTQ